MTNIEYCLWGNVSCLSRSLYNKFQILEKCLCGTKAINKLLWWINGLFSAVVPVVRLASYHRRVGPRTSDEVMGLAGQAGQCTGLILHPGQLSEVAHPGEQMVDYMGCSHVPMAQLPTPEESTSWVLNHPRSSGVCHCRSQQCDQTLLFQMEWQTMHNMSQGSLWDRLV